VTIDYATINICSMEREYGLHKNYEMYLKTRIERCKANLIKYQGDAERQIQIMSQIVMDQIAIKQYRCKNSENSPWLSESFKGRLEE